MLLSVMGSDSENDDLNVLNMDSDEQENYPCVNFDYIKFNAKLEVKNEFGKKLKIERIIMIRKKAGRCMGILWSTPV
jgi:hypothetical protein